MQYTVKPGDTLSKLAIQFYGNMARWPEIQRANNIANPNLILIGQKLWIPGLDAVSGDYMYPSNATTSMPYDPNERALRITVTDGTYTPPVAPAPAPISPTSAPLAASAPAWLRNPWLWAIGALAAFLLADNKPPRKRARRPRKAQRGGTATRPRRRRG